VNLPPDIMPGAMDKIFRVARLFNHAARGAIHLPTLYGAALTQRLLHERHGAVARLLHDAKNLAIFCRDLPA
jgi:hypothetical protein